MAFNPADEAKDRPRPSSAPLMALLGLGLVVGVVVLAVVLWPRNSGTGDDDSEAGEPNPEQAFVLLSTEEGEALLGDIFDQQMERLIERRNRHAKETVRALENHKTQSDAQVRQVREASEALTREGQRLPIGPERTALLDVSVKLLSGPELTIQERILLQKYDRLAGAALKLTRGGALPLNALLTQHAADRAALDDRMKQRGARLADQAKALEAILDGIRETEDFEGALLALSKAVVADRDFGEALVVRGAVHLIVHGDHGPALLDGDTAIRIDAGNAGAYLIRGFAAYRRGSPGAAQADFQQAIGIEPHFRRHRVIFRLIDLSL